jgi:prepilin-type processing-associated H-X9-DG protein
LIELLIVISIIGVLAAVLLPQVIANKDAANVASDALQMRTHYNWFTIYKMKNNQAVPTEDGFRFVLSSWTSGVAPHTEENLDKFFAPGARDGDAHYHEMRDKMAMGENPWPSLKDCTSEDTHYVGRAKQYLRSVETAGEAMMADDNEGGLWTHRDGSVNILMGDGNVRTRSYSQLEKLYGLGPFDKDAPVPTFGASSPITECQHLAN